MYYHRLTVSYKGTSYYGWQDIGEGEEKPTIQGSIQKVLQKICNYKGCTIATASRTDAGVHAQGQVIKICIGIKIESEKLLLGMNSLLPDDIRIVECHPSTKAFNPNKSSKSKEYHYYFSTDTMANPIFNDTVTHIPSRNNDSTAEPLNIELMQQACNLFVGEHDFYSFAKRDSTMSSTFRTIVSCEIIQTKSLAFNSNVYYLKIVGEGFLRYMVRYMVGALFAVGKRQISLNDIREAIEKHKEDKLSAKANARGLHLIQVFY